MLRHLLDFSFDFPLLPAASLRPSSSVARDFLSFSISIYLPIIALLSSQPWRVEVRHS